MAQLQHTIYSNFNQPNQQAEPLKETNPKKKKKRKLKTINRLNIEIHI